MKNENTGNGNSEIKKDDFQGTNKSAGENRNQAIPVTGNNGSPESDIDDTDKYLAMEQPGVTYTEESESVHLSDEDYAEQNQGKWNEEGGNSEYSDAFNQDDYILEDNIDLDEDQNKSVSSDDEDCEETNERY